VVSSVQHCPHWATREFISRGPKNTGGLDSLRNS